MVKDAMMEEKATENGNITATFVAEQVAAAAARVTEPLVQKMVEMEERLTAQIGASSAHHSSGTHGNNHQLCRLRDVWIHICIPVTSIKILMQRNGTSISLIGMFVNVLCYRQQIYILGGKDGCRG